MINRTDFIRTHKDLIGNKEGKWSGNILQMYAENLARHPTNEEETAQVNMTPLYFKEIEREIANGEIVKQQINAKPRQAKSTEGIALAIWILNLVRKYYPKECGDKQFSMSNIARDDQELAKMMRNPDLMFSIIMIDENNALEETGENATTEMAQKEVFSDVQAGRYVHNIYVCPEKVMDKNVDIKLIIRNREKGLIHNYLYYKLPLVGWVFLGYVDVDVSKLIENWETRVKRRFYQYLKDKDENGRKFIEYWMKRDFYVEYQVKKYEKMELMNREGVLRPRELDYAYIVLEVIEKTKGLVELMPLSQLRLPVRSYVEMEFHREKIPSSMVGIQMTTERVLSVLTLISTKRSIKLKISDYWHKFNKGKMSDNDYNKAVAELKKHEEEIDNLVIIQINELKRYKEVNEKYNKHIE